MSGQVYAIVQGFNGFTLAHATNPKLVGKNVSEVQDLDGQYFAKDMGDLGRKKASICCTFKFVNPMIKKIQLKHMYCQSLNQTIFCAGVYRS